MRRYALRDDQWDRIEDHVPGREGSVGVTAADNRLFVEAVIYRYRAGIPWRDLPERFGDWKNVHRRFSRWAQSGVWERVFQLLAADADNEYAMIDSTIVRAHQHSAGAQKRMARPVCKRHLRGDLTGLRQRIRSRGLSPRPRWSSAHPGPHKTRGVERHFPGFQGAGSTVRPSRVHRPQTSLTVSSRLPPTIDLAQATTVPPIGLAM
jgi:transposase